MTAPRRLTTPVYWTRNRKVALSLSALSLARLVAGILISPGLIAGILLYASTMAAYNAGRFIERNATAVP